MPRWVHHCKATCKRLVVRKADGLDGDVAEKFGGSPGFFGLVEFDAGLRAKPTGGRLESSKTKERKRTLNKKPLLQQYK